MRAKWPKLVPPSANQGSDDIGDVIIGCLNECEPRLRYATNEYGEKRMKDVYDDGVGDRRAVMWYDVLSPALKN